MVSGLIAMLHRMQRVVGLRTGLMVSGVGSRVPCRFRDTCAEAVLLFTHMEHPKPKIMCANTDVVL